VSHDAAAARLLPELEDYSGLVIQAGTFLAAYGAADRYLGMLASLLGRPEAEDRFEDALRLESRARMPVWLARTQAEYGHHLLRSGGDEGAERAATLLRFAADSAHRLGMRSLERSATEALRGATVSTRSRAPATADLTDRELEVLRLLVDGCSNRQIGEALSISHHTAANHVRAILMKAGCTNRTEAASWALRLGLT
jgi:DNA-binding NarL/FixJ family response regulator